MSVGKRNAALLDVRRLSKSYARLEAVHDVSFPVRRGEIVGLLGSNGAGKTTTINMVLGLLTPTSGAVKIFGQPWNTTAARSLAT